VARQRLLTRLADAGAVLLQARQHDLVAVIHLGPAKPRNVAGAGVMARLLLRRSRRRHQNQWNNEKKSGHFYLPSRSNERGSKPSVVKPSIAFSGESQPWNLIW